MRAVMSASLRTGVLCSTLSLSACGADGSTLDDGGLSPDAAVADGATADGATSDAAVTLAPRISGFDPATPFAGTELVVEGERFGTNIEGVRVFFDESPTGGVVPTLVADGAITITIPVDLPGLGAGVNKIFDVRVQVEGRVSPPVPITVRPPLTP